MKKLSTLLLMTCFAFSLFGQQYWSDVTASDLHLDQSKRSVTPEQYRTLELQFTDWQNLLATAPASFGAKKGTLVALPLPNGKMEQFYITTAETFMPTLAAKYPQIRAYRGIGVNNPDATAYLDINSHNFHAVVRTTEGEIYIEPILEDNDALYQSYFTRDAVNTETDIPLLSCGYNPYSKEVIENENVLSNPNSATAKSNGIIQLRSYRMAVSATSAFSGRFGGTTESVLESFNTALVRLNEIFEREVAITFTLVPESEDLIFLDAATEPYNNLNNGGMLLGQSQLIYNNIIDPSLYDIGHVFTGNCTDVGGVARLAQVCTGEKMRGVTCFGGDLLFDVVRILAHEVGHQFGATHTMSQCDGNEENLTSSSAYEPGSGSTIMSYSGGCGEQNVQFGPDDYFHSYNLEQMIAYSRNDNGNSCANLVDINNNEPIVSLDYEDGFIIPINTPFVLNGTVTDPDGDELFYSWEQLNLGPPADLGTQIINSPGFRSYPPSASAQRTFPRKQALVDNFREETELLPTYSRDYTFRFTARDENEAGGAAVWQDVSFEASASAGPFLVTTANEAGMMWEVGQYQEVTWDVANTDNATVNCQAVNILLSLDGGFTYPLTVVENTPNDGSEFITVPDAIGDKVRIRVQAANNIFFDISNQNLEIVAPSAPGYSLTVTPNGQDVCVPNIVEIEISSTSLLDFAEEISLEVTDGVPGDVTFSLADATIQPGEQTTLTVDFTNSAADGDIAITLEAIAADTVTATRIISFNAINTDFSAVVQLSPEDGASGLVGAPTFTWGASDFANTYDFEIATDASFGASFLVQQAFGLTETEFTIAQPLEEMTTFYWRVRAENECGAGDWNEPFTLSSVSAVCSPLSSTDVPLNLPSSGMVSSTLNISTSGEINDLQVPIMRGSFPGVNGLVFTLRSPTGTEVVLFSRNCGLTNGFNLGFDDDAPDAIACPPTSGGVFQPIESLSAFNGEDTQGEWALIVDVQDPGFGGGGSLDEWQLEFCSLVNTTEIGDNSQIKVFPNPAKDVLTLEMAQPISSDAVLSIYNAQGQLVSTNTVANPQNNITVKTNDLPSGIYLLSVLSDNQLFTKQFVKL